MRDKRIKLIYFTLGGSEARQISLDWKRILLLGTGSVLGLCFIAAIILGGFTKVLHSYQNNRLSKANTQLQDQLEEMDEIVKNLDNKIKLIEQGEKDYAVFLDMRHIDDDIRGVGTGGYARTTYRYEATSALNSDVRNEAFSIHSKLEELSRRIELSEKTRKEIRGKWFQKEDDLKKFPSIWPVSGRRITDKFGPRIHPLTGLPDDHKGIDISAPRGTPVHASADGIVITSENTFIPNKGLGRYIKIDHGNGYITKYGHLSKILVKVGDRINRNDIIGKVGTTGSSTAPHLHYEVVVENNAKDPYQFMLDD